MKWTMRMMVKRAVPPILLNNVLLAFPSLYRRKIVNYETNISADGIDDLLSQLELTLALPGNIIECGSSRCGASIIMANYCKARCIDKTIYACDSFEGFDLDELRRERQAGLTATGEKDCTSTSHEYVRKKIIKLGVDNFVIPIKGYFQDTLPNINSNFCFALVDCDLKDSLFYCAETIWPNLVHKGRILFDDYLDDDFKGARLGVDHFVQKYSKEIGEHGLKQRLYVVKKV